MSGMGMGGASGWMGGLFVNRAPAYSSSLHTLFAATPCATCACIFRWQSVVDAVSRAGGGSRTDTHCRVRFTLASGRPVGWLALSCFKGHQQQACECLHLCTKRCCTTLQDKWRSMLKALPEEEEQEEDQQLQLPAGGKGSGAAAGKRQVRPGASPPGWHAGMQWQPLVLRPPHPPA